MSIDLTVFTLGTLGLSFGVALVGATVGLHLKNRIPGLGIRDNLRASVYVTQYDAALEYQGLRRRELRARVNELRANLAESSADGGAAAAIERLGPPRVLAAEVAGTRLVPSWSRGALWVLAAIVFGLVTLLMSANAFTTGVDSSAPGASATWSPLLWTMTSTSKEGAPASFELEVPFTTLLLLSVPFLVGARVWRLWTGRSAQRGSRTSR